MEGTPRGTRTQDAASIVGVDLEHGLCTVPDHPACASRRSSRFSLAEGLHAPSRRLASEADADGCGATSRNAPDLKVAFLNSGRGYSRQEASQSVTPLMSMSASPMRLNAVDNPSASPRSLAAMQSALALLTIAWACSHRPCCSGSGIVK